MRLNSSTSFELAPDTVCVYRVNTSVQLDLNWQNLIERLLR